MVKIGVGLLIMHQDVGVWKRRHQAGPTPWRSRCFAVIFFLSLLIIASFECCRRARRQRLSFLMFLPLCHIFFASICDVNSFLLFDFLGRSDCCGPVFSLSMQSSTPQSYAFSLISLLFPPVFFEERESWREGFLDLLTKAKCKEKRGWGGVVELFDRL